jgi:RimJ/RimL family protein N-acetyltransferase
MTSRDGSRAGADAQVAIPLSSHSRIGEDCAAIGYQREGSMEFPAKDVIEIGSTLGTLRLRPERDEDDAFRLALFCESRPAEFALLQLDATGLAQLMRFQFQAQTLSYRASFPDARFDIIELDRLAIGRIVVDRPGGVIHIVDRAIVPSLRNQGLGTAIMKALMNEAAENALPVRLMVASSNDPSMRLYLRLGFVPIMTEPLHIEMEWRAPKATTPESGA